MLKRTIFLLSYFAFLILVPVAVYHFWPTQMDYITETRPEQMMIDPESPTADMELAAALDTYNDSFAQMARGVHMLFAVGICFFVSLVVALVLSIWKFARPQKKLGGITLGILIFNVVYIPVYAAALFLIFPIIGYLFLFGFGMARPDISSTIYTVLGLFVFTIAFLTGGMIRAAKIPSPMLSPYDLPGNQQDNNALNNQPDEWPKN